MFHHILNHLMTEHLFSCFLSRKFTWNWWIIEEFCVWLVGQLKIFFRICLFVCFAAISSQASIFSTSHMKLHFFFFMIFLLLLLWDTFRSQTLWGIIYIFKTLIYEYYICIISIPSLPPPHHSAMSFLIHDSSPITIMVTYTYVHMPLAYWVHLVLLLHPCLWPSTWVGSPIMTSSLEKTDSFSQ